LIVLTLVLGGLLAIRLRAQGAALRAPSGGSGEIEGTEINLASKISARVLSLAVEEGVAVKKGDLILTLDCDEQMAALAEAESRLVTARAQAKAAVVAIGASRATHGAAFRNVDAAKAQASAVLAQRDSTQRQAERLDAVASDVSFAERDRTHLSLAGLESQLRAAQVESSVAAQQARAAAGQIEVSQAQAEAAAGSALAAQAALERAQLTVAECELRTPRDAQVEELPYEAGELVSPGAILARLIDLHEVKAIFYLPNAELAAARPGIEAVIVADAWPGAQFKGKVRTVAFKAEFTPRNIQTRSDRDRLVYPVEVVLSNPELKLRAGMPVQVILPGTER
jgi:HlyD family secretion protein